MIEVTEVSSASFVKLRKLSKTGATIKNGIKIGKSKQKKKYWTQEMKTV